MPAEKSIGTILHCIKTIKILVMLTTIKTKIMCWVIDTVTPIISIFYHPQKWPYTISGLLQMPDESLGKQTALLLQQQHFSFIPKYESNDCKHVLLDYKMDGLGESRMVFFTLGNKSFITCITIV